MKIIDLLNKIANGEEYSKKARIRYFDKQNDYKDECILTIYAIGYRLHNAIFGLNDEVEIIEEEKKIPEKLEEFGLINYNLDYIDYKNIETLKEWLNKDFQTIYDTIDLIIKNQNKLIDYLKNKGE